MNIRMPNKGAAPNRRLRFGPAPWSFGFFMSPGSAVGELGRSATARLLMGEILCPQNTQKDADFSFFSACSACSAGKVRICSGESGRHCRLARQNWPGIFGDMSTSSPNQPDGANRRQPLGFREHGGEACVRGFTAAVAHPGRSASAYA